MKIAISILLMILLTFQVLLKTVLVVEYSMNKAYIAATLCINRERPELCCEGKCYLQRSINKSNEAEQKTIPYSLKEKESVYCIHSFDFNFFSSVLMNQLRVYPMHADAAVISVSRSVFHPPPLPVGRL